MGTVTPTGAGYAAAGIPVYSIRGEDTGSRGLGQASGNVLLNGERISGKSPQFVAGMVKR